MDLRSLEYPRHLHKSAGAYLRVNTHDEAAAAVADGWRIEVPVEGGPAHDPREDPPAAVDPVVDVPKRGRPKGKK